MSFVRRFSPALIATLSLVFLLSAAVSAKKTNNEFPQIKIKNFGQMDERFYRGARPKEEDFKALAAMGIKTVIDLTDNSREKEQPAAEAAGLRYVNIPMVDKGYPPIEQINEFMKVVNDPETGKFFVHCAGGRHRTGVVGAVYRFQTSGWDFDKVFAEMNEFEFGSGFGHGKQKDFVEDYWKDFQKKQAEATAATVAK